eukprot:scaffold5866_cov93-Isochrysis_galbana.AAC.12
MRDARAPAPHLPPAPLRPSSVFLPPSVSFICTFLFRLQAGAFAAGPIRPRLTEVPFELSTLIEQSLIDEAAKLPAERIPVRRRQLRQRHDDHLLIWVDGEEGGGPPTPAVLSLGAEEGGLDWVDDDGDAEAKADAVKGCLREARVGGDRVDVHPGRNRGGGSAREGGGWGEKGAVESSGRRMREDETSRRASAAAARDLRPPGAAEAGAPACGAGALEWQLVAPHELDRFPGEDPHALERGGVGLCVREGAPGGRAGGGTAASAPLRNRCVLAFGAHPVPLRLAGTGRNAGSRALWSACRRRPTGSTAYPRSLRHRLGRGCGTGGGRAPRYQQA